MGPGNISVSLLSPSVSQSHFFSPVVIYLEGDQLKKIFKKSQKIVKTNHNPTHHHPSQKKFRAKKDYPILNYDPRLTLGKVDWKS